MPSKFWKNYFSNQEFCTQPKQRCETDSRVSVWPTFTIGMWTEETCVTSEQKLKDYLWLDTCSSHLSWDWRPRKGPAEKRKHRATANPGRKHSHKKCLLLEASKVLGSFVTKAWLNLGWHDPENEKNTRSGKRDLTEEKRRGRPRLEREQIVQSGTGEHRIPGGMSPEGDKMTDLPEVLECIERTVTFPAKTMEKN